ncbi:hypothetical protein Vse01_29150 [Micromonospora sediminimaris]|uniref:Uncharacterized protein n=1 Tax=Micromonospora sediminimaris TaxID=547162 RepID=A0A9W5XKA7_9ACTN|nr:hypothetical protein Vse01_29150 [Micromonospora sediminimaris]
MSAATTCDYRRWSGQQREAVRANRTNRALAGLLVHSRAQRTSINDLRPGERSKLAIPPSNACGAGYVEPDPKALVASISGWHVVAIRHFNVKPARTTGARY